MLILHLHVQAGLLSGTEVHVQIIDTQTRSIQDLLLNGEQSPWPLVVSEGALVAVRVTGRNAIRKMNDTAVLRAESGTAFHWESRTSRVLIRGDGARLLARFEADPPPREEQREPEEECPKPTLVVG